MYIEQGCERDLQVRDRDETETRPRRLTLHPRRERDETFTKTLRDRDETETLDFLFETRPRRDVPNIFRDETDRDNL